MAMALLDYHCELVCTSSVVHDEFSLRRIDCEGIDHCSSAGRREKVLAARKEEPDMSLRIDGLLFR